MLSALWALHPVLAGDAMDDANFEHTTANGAILRLTKELAWAGGRNFPQKLRGRGGAGRREAGRGGGRRGRGVWWGLASRERGRAAGLPGCRF